MLQCHACQLLAKTAGQAVALRPEICQVRSKVNYMPHLLSEGEGRNVKQTKTFAHRRKNFQTLDHVAWLFKHYICFKHYLIVPPPLSLAVLSVTYCPNRSFHLKAFHYFHRL